MECDNLLDSLKQLSLYGSGAQNRTLQGDPTILPGSYKFPFLQNAGFYTSCSVSKKKDLVTANIWNNCKDRIRSPESLAVRKRKLYEMQSVSVEDTEIGHPPDLPLLARAQQLQKRRESSSQ